MSAARQLRTMMPIRSHVGTCVVHSIPVMLRTFLSTIVFVISLLSALNILADTNVAIPKPSDELLPPPPPPKLEPSIVHLTIGRNLREMREAVESSIPVHHRHEVEWVPGKQTLNGKPFEYQYYLWRGPVNFKTDGNRLVTEFPDVRYRVRVRLKEPNGDTRIAECGYGPDAHMRMRLEAYSDVRWSKDWGVRTKTSFGRPQYGEPCRLSNIDLDITELLDEWFAQRLPPLASVIDQAFRDQAKAKARAQIIWAKFQEPIELKSGIWLAYRPQDPRAGPVTVNGDQSVQTSVSMAFDPMIVAGEKPQIEATPLPALHVGPTAQDGFHLAVPLLVPYDELNNLVAKETVGGEINPPVGSKITVTGVQLYGSGKNLICEVTVTGGVNGKLYIQGMPSLTPDGRTLEFSGFDFTVETSNLLVKSTNRLMHDSIRDRVLPQTRIDLRDRIDLLRSRIERQMNRELSPGIWVQGAVSKLEPYRIYPVPGGLEMQLVIDGTLGLVIR